jgi:hypothetical protein
LNARLRYDRTRPHAAGGDSNIFASVGEETNGFERI